MTIPAAGPLRPGMFDSFQNPGFVLIEKLVSFSARKINERCLRFSEPASLTLPRGSAELPTLLYIHVPFCEQLCPYCSFNRVEFREDLARAYFSALRKEILMYRDLGYNFRALYAGGGTPTVLMDELEATLRLIKANYDISEISLETNPDHLTEDNLRRLKGIGVSRLSVGVQTFDDRLLKSLNRYHKYGSGDRISERLRKTQGVFDTLNVDMIAGFPGQTMGMLENDLATIAGLGVDQVTYYPLMSSSASHDSMNREFGSLPGGNDRAFYSRICEMLAPQYSAATVWCFSRGASPIDEYPVAYGEYAGLGSGAIGMLGGSAYANTFDIREYIEKIDNGRLPVAAKKDYSIRDRIRYDFLMKLFGLRLDISELNAKYGLNVSGYIWPEISFFRLIGGIEKQGNMLTLTPKGRYYWFIMMREFFSAVNNFRDYCRAQIKG
jgi:menaquinone C8-methyltransferase